MPTGCGKTVAFTSLAADLRWPTLVLVHRDELARQAVATFGQLWPDATVGVVQAERDEWERTPDGDEPDVVVASVASLHTARLDRIPSERFGLVIADEAHHAVAPTWVRILDHFESKFLLGCTATPERADGRGLAERFGPRPLYAYPLRQAIDDEHLARVTQYAIETNEDLDGVSHRAGDFAEGELSRCVNTLARNKVVVEAYCKHAAGRRGLAFSVDVQHARDLTGAFTQAGITAALVTGTTPRDERRQLLADFAAGKVQVMVNCAVLIEGFDDPGIGCILMARPTCSRPLYVQCIGRGLRKAPGKTDCMVLDFVDNSKKHKLVTLLDLLGAPNARNANGQDAIEVADADQVEAEHRHEIATAQPLSWRLAAVCPWPDLPNLRGYVATAYWHCAEASDKQLRYLHSFGIDVSRPLTKGECSYLIDRSREYEAAWPTPATSKQVYCLRRAGLWRQGMSKREASVLIGKLKAGELVGAVA